VRIGVVVWLLALGACESRYGSYFNIDGDANEIRFDKVQLYWGNDPHQRPIGTPTGTVMGTVYTREFDAASDEYAVPHNADGSLATETTYWLPVTEDNRQLGYVAAVVYDSAMPGKPVGVGEWQDFSLEDNIVAKFDIELQKPPLNVVDKLELWGNAPGCFAWETPREGQLSTIAVVLPDDADCDGHVAMADCNDVCPPNTPTCDQMLAVCATAAQQCALSCNKSSPTSCTPEVCLPAEICGTSCAGFPSTLEDRMRCYSTHAPAGTAFSHSEIELHKDTEGKLCTDTVRWSPFGRPCKNPIIEWYDTSLDDYQYQVTERSDGQCELKLRSETNAAFFGDHHLLISIDPMVSGAPRWSFVIGLNGLDSQGCTPPFDQLNETQGGPFDCQ
jgi:hypothetical protein